MSTKLSFTDKLIIAAKLAGYYADKDGSIYNPRGKHLKGGTTKRGYRTFTPAVYPDGKRGCALQHRFVAYFFHGDEVFNHKCVRHLNDVPTDNRLCNLALGSYQDNSLDIPVEKRKERSKGAGVRITEQNRKLTNQQVIKIRQHRQQYHTPFSKLAKMYGVSTMTVYRAATGKSWSNI